MTQDPSTSPPSEISDDFDEVDDSLTKLLDSKLVDFDLPTRMANWANRKGISTLSELVRFSPATLLAERNLGRTSIRETRSIVERALGASWEELHRHLSMDGSAPTSESARLPIGSSEAPVWNWDDLQARLSPSALSTPLDALDDLPTRMKNLAAREGIHTVRELVQIPRAHLVATANIGKKSLAQTFEKLISLHRRELEGPSPVPALENYAGFFDVWQRHQAELTPLDRLVMSHRAGFHGPAPTLQELGNMFNLSRERIRQIESRAIARLKKGRWWIDACESRLEAMLDCGIRSLEEVEVVDPFFREIEERFETFAFFLRELTTRKLHIVDWDGHWLLGTFSQSSWDASFRQICVRLSSSSFPIARSDVESLIVSELGELPAAAFPYIWERIRPYLFFDENGGETVLGYGRYREAEVLAFLLGAPRPVRVSELVERFGRGRLPDDVIFIDRGLVGTPHHLSDYEVWAERLPPICAALMQRIAPERQFTTAELVEVLREEAQVPRWLNAWTLGSILRNAHQVRYLGRNVTALPEVEGDRVHVRRLFVSILEEAGRPLPASDILALGAERRGSSGAGERQLLSRPPFIDTEEGIIGLVARDLPGGTAALERATEALSMELERRQTGILALEAIRFVRALSSTHDAWSAAMVRSAARHDARLRLVSNGSIGLSEWGEVRAPNRRDILIALLEEHGGRVPVDVAIDHIETAFGVRLSPPALGCIANSAGARMTGGFVVRADLVPPLGRDPTEPLLRPSSLPGFPPEAEPLFVRLLDETIGDLDALSRDVDSHLARYELEARNNEFLDPAEARMLAARCRELLARSKREAASRHRQLIWAAVRYFAIDDDGNSDFTIGGLDDDRAVVDAVQAYLDGSEGPEPCRS